MNKPLKLILTLVAVITCVAALSSVNKPVTSYRREQVKGNVRVVLLRVDRTTVFSDEGVREAKSGEVHAIPGLSIVYAVEILGNEPITVWNVVRDDKIATVNGKPLTQTLPENIVAGGYGTSLEYRNYNWAMLMKPAVTDPKRTHIEEVWERGVRIAGGQIDVRIKAGYNDHTEEFVFDGISLE